jgi:hypothetical protein
LRYSREDKHDQEDRQIRIDFAPPPADDGKRWCRACGIAFPYQPAAVAGSHHHLSRSLTGPYGTERSEGIMPVLVDEMFELFRAMKAQGTTVLLVEQNVELALEIADRAYVMDQGAVVHQASARELLADNDIKERYCSV